MPLKSGECTAVLGFGAPRFGDVGFSCALLSERALDTITPCAVKILGSMKRSLILTRGLPKAATENEVSLFAHVPVRTRN